MIIPDEAIPYIQLQRTDHKNPETIKADYVDDIAWDYNSIKKHIPEKAESILDIGCGVGLINVFLYALYDQPVLHLLDKTEVGGQIYYGMADRTPYYNSLQVTAKTMLDNDILCSNVICLEANEQFKIKAPNKSMDLITSFISWGFHYPVHTYIDDVIRVLKPGGVLIMDLRDKTDVNLLTDRFNRVDIICQKNKATRVSARFPK